MNSVPALPLSPAPAAHAAPPATAPGRPAAGRPRGSWHYERSDRPWLLLLLSLFISGTLHAVLLYGFNAPKKVVRAAVAQEIEIVQITMPDLKEDEEPPVEDLAGQEPDESPAVAVPMLADVPSAVNVSAFVQPLQYVPEVNSNLAAAKVSQIPLHIARGGRSLASLGQIFEISQLDRAPTPIAQPSPVFPFQLKKDYSEAVVWVEFIVDPAGNVVNPVAQPAVHRDFETAAVAGVAKWKFRPGQKAGKKVSTRVRVPLRFEVVPD